MSEEKEAFSTIAYDLPSEYLGFLQAVDGDSEAQLKQKDKTKSDIGRLRLRFYNDLRTIGRYVNNSVFIIPKSKISEGEEIIAKTEANYAKLIEEVRGLYGKTLVYDITTIQFASSESVRLRGKAKATLIQELDKLCDILDERCNNAKKKKVQTRSVVKQKEDRDAIEKVLAGFKLDDDPEVKQLLQLADLKLLDYERQAIKSGVDVP